LAYRSKEASRAVDELEYLVTRHHVNRACSADNILDFRYFDTLLPMLRDAALELAFVFEMKTNLSRFQIETLLDAGLGAAQLGVETFITPVLKRIGKGANALQNLQTLKWFSEAGIEVKWNLLYGFPGEEAEGYRDLADLIPAIVHLAPPLAVGRVRLDRFSPYFQDPQAHGMANPRPHRAFAYVYPFAEDQLRRLAYYYEYDYADGRDPLDYAASCLEAIDTWRQLAGSVTLRAWDREDGLLILTDTRPCATALQHRLKGLAREAYVYCDTGRSEKKIIDFAAERSAGEPVDEQAVRQMLDGWLRDRLMVLLDGRYLSLALWSRDEKRPHLVAPN
jgi:ribosomal peptide maturation radical SAM protein 1